MCTERKRKNLNGLNRRPREERGAVAVEMAIVLPLLVMMVFGIIEFGRYYNTTITLSHAAREAVRKVAIANSGNPTTTANNAASPLVPKSVTTSAVPCVAGTNASATVAFDFTYNIPLVAAGTKTISKTAVMRCGG